MPFCTSPQAYSTASPRMSTMRPSSCWSATSGGEIWIDGVTAVVEPAEQAVLVEPGREHAAQQPVGLVALEGLLGVAVLDHLEREEVTDAADVTDQRDAQQLAEPLLAGRARSRARCRARSRARRCR